MPPTAQLPVEQVSSHRFRIPIALRAVNGKMADIEGPAQLLLHLTGGHELEIPLTQDAIKDLYSLMGSLRSS